MALNIPERKSLGVFPTPLVSNLALGKVVDIPNLWVKRDDLSGFSWGGNKVRTAEFILAEAIAEEVSDIVLAGGPTSNFAAIMAAAGKQSGIAVHQVAYGNEPEDEVMALRAGRDAGASVTFTGSADRSLMETHAAILGKEIDARGGRVMVLPRGGATPVGSVGFFDAALELDVQLKALGLHNATVVIPVGSVGSIAGLVAGRAHLGATWHVIGASVSRPANEVAELLSSKVSEVASLLDLNCDAELSAGLDEVKLVDCRGEGFGAETAEQRAFRSTVSAASGLVIDPTYNAKALAWLAETFERNSGERNSDHPVIYWLTGGLLNALPPNALPPNALPPTALPRKKNP